MEKQTTTGTLWQDLSALPRAYWILFGGTLINRFGHFVLPFLSIHLRHEGFSAWAIATALSCYGAGAWIGGLLGGYLADKIGRKSTMILSCVGGAFFMLALSQAHIVPVLLTIVFFNGLFNAMYGPAGSALIADLVPPHLRVRAFSSQRLAINFGFGAGMAVAGLVAKYSFFVLFVADAATTLVMAAAVAIGLKNHTHMESARKGGWGIALRHMKTNSAFKLAIAASFLMSLVLWQLSTTYGLQVTAGARLDERTYGFLLALNGLMVVLLELPLTSWTRRFSPSRVMAVGYAVLGAGLGFNILGPTLPILITSMVILTLGEMISFPINNSYMAALAPDAMRGRYQGVAAITGSSATLFAPFLSMPLYHFNATLHWSAIFGLSLIAAYLMWVTRRSVEHGTAG